jgi:hypothetical protein
MRKSPSNKLSFETVLNEFLMRNCTMIDDSYKDRKTNINYICEIHYSEVQLVRYDVLVRDDYSPCKYCRKELKKQKFIEKIKYKFNELNWILLSEDYVDQYTILYYQCLHHPNEVQQTCWKYVRDGQGCKFCGIEKVANSRRYDFDFVNKTFEEKNYTLLEKKYFDSNTTMNYICNIHPHKTQSTTFINVLLFPNNCKECMILYRNEKLRHDYDFIKFEFDKANFILLEEEYISSNTKMKCICKNHLEIVQEIPYISIYGGHKCRFCFYESNTGENNPSWNGGVTTDDEKFRRSPEYKGWRMEVLKRDNYTCQRCNNRRELQVHHIDNFSRYVDKRIDINNGITLCKNCHDPSIKGSFHNIYGTFNNSKEQLEEYIKNYEGNENVR